MSPLQGQLSAWPLTQSWGNSEGPARLSTPLGMGWGLPCDCTAAQSLSLPSPASVSFVGINPKTSLVNFLRVYLLLRVCVPWNSTFFQHIQFISCLKTCATANLGRLKSYQVYFLTTVGWNQKSKAEGKLGKLTSMWKLTDTLLNNQWVTDEIKRKVSKYLGKKKTKMKTQHIKTSGIWQKQY